MLENGTYNIRRAKIQHEAIISGIPISFMKAEKLFLFYINILV